VRRGSIGTVILAPMTTEIAQQLGTKDARGLLVQRIARASSAYAGGLRPGDIIVGFNGTAIEDGGVLLRLVQDAPIGSTATMDVIRDGRRVQLRIPIVRASEQ
jgi:S1-C subfamily serine protease